MNVYFNTSLTLSGTPEVIVDACCIYYGCLLHLAVASAMVVECITTAASTMPVASTVSAAFTMAAASINGCCIYAMAVASSMDVASTSTMAFASMSWMLHILTLKYTYIQIRIERNRTESNGIERNRTESNGIERNRTE